MNGKGENQDGHSEFGDGKDLKTKSFRPSASKEVRFVCCWEKRQP